MVSAYCIAALLVGTAPPAKLARFEFESKHMGTGFRITLYAPDEAGAKQAAEAGFARVAELEKVLSDYDPQSEVMRLCRLNDAAPGRPIPASADLFAALEASQKLSELSGGAFDVTVGPLTKLWRLARRTQEPTPPAELVAALELVGHRKLTLDAQARTVTLAQAKMRLDFGGIGKGFAADAVRELLAVKYGLTRTLVAASGDVTCGDAPPGEAGWAVDIAPLRKDGPARRLLLKNASVSTSGDLDQVAVIAGVRYSHVLNPKTGVGLTGRRSVTVVAPAGTQADALTKAASVLDPAAALKLLDGLDGVATLITVQPADDRPEAVTASKRFPAFLAPPAKPRD